MVASHWKVNPVTEDLECPDGDVAVSADGSIPYNNASSGLAADTVSEAIDELALGALGATRFRRKNVTTSPYSLVTADFPTLEDPRPVLLCLTGVTSVVATAELALPQTVSDDVPFVNLLVMDASTVTYSAEAPGTLLTVDSEAVAGGQYSQQILSRIDATNDTWVLGGRTQ